MCGILGLINSKKIKKDVFIGALNDLNHRGPDNTGYWQNEDKNIMLGHKRLTILDLQHTGNQPMISKSNRYVIVYNGEIYNFLNLKNQLIQEGQQHFIGTSDTEVVLNAIETWGIEKTLSLLDGMFSFSIYDKAKDLIYLCRDRFGEKPLYYGKKNNFFFFTSELKPLKKFFSFDLNFNEKAINLYFKFGYIPHPYTILEDVYKLEPGKFLIFSIKKNEIIDIKNYYELKDVFIEPRNENKNLNQIDTTNLFENNITKSIESRTISDVGYGVFLSSGIDSSLIASILALKCNKKIDTYTIGLKDKLHNEASSSKLIADHLKSNHHELIIDHSDLLNSLDQITDVFDEPFADSSQVPTILLSRFASDTNKVCLTGDGGDEVFSGYNRHKKINYFFDQNKIIKIFLNFLISRFNNPQLVKNLYSLLKILVPSSFKSGIPYEHIQKVQIVLSSKTKIEAYERLNEIFFPEELKLILKNYVIDYPYFQKTNIENIDKNIFQYYDFINYLPNDILCKVDRSSMYNSLETRTPYLNKDFIEFYFGLNPKFTYENKTSKFLSKKLLSKFLPNKLFNLPKRGFGIPLDDWLRGPLKNLVTDIIFSNNSYISNYINNEKAEIYYKQFLKGKNHHYKLWALIVFELWNKKYREL